MEKVDKLIRNIQIVVEYNGENFAGWQIQPNKKTVQGEIIKAIKSVTNEEVELIGSGRTDSNVSAYMQTANFHLKNDILLSNIQKGVNSKLKGNIVIKEIKEIDINFHSRYDQKKKTYIYIINNTQTKSAIYKNREYHYSKFLDVEKMNQAIKKLEGKHDFKAFKSSGSPKKSTVREIYSAEVKKINLDPVDRNNKNMERIMIKITGNGFLYNMVRIIAGTVLEVGEGKKEVSDIEKILNSKIREKAGRTLPAEGLFLYKVEY